MCDLDIKKDWENIDFEGAYMNANIVGEEFSWMAGEQLKLFIKQVELIRDEQIKAVTKNIPSLLKKEN